MFKALDVRDNTEVVILDQKWVQSISQLRSLARQDFLICQGCKQPVWVRAGEQRREHFAHKHKNNCDYADESAILRNARAVLYEWLVSKFGKYVSIEKSVDGLDLFRTIDCWVEKDASIFAYWIFDTGLKPEKREILKSRLEKQGIHINWVFAREMLHPESDSLDRLVLSTTEREFIQRSKYDMAYDRSNSMIEGSLHYLDADNRKLHTFRSLSLYHKPQVYMGYNQTSELAETLISPKNGEFVHSGEYDKRREYERLQKLERNDNKEGVSMPSAWQDDNATPSKLETIVGVCVFCGETTQDWWSYDGKTGQCKCKSCLQQGKS